MGIMGYSSSCSAMKTRGIFLVVGALATFASTQAAAGFEEVGCYQDKKGLIMERGFISDSMMTVEKCYAHCTNSIYFGVKYGTKCFCDAGEHDMDYPFDVYGVSTACDMPCSGDQEDNCGGEWAMRVFQKDYAEIGCFNDRGGSARIMVRPTVNRQSMTVEMCQAHCRDSLYFGLQSDDECWCDKATGDLDYPFDKYGESTRCTAPCPGNGAQTCGGEGSMTVYMNTDY